MLQLFLITQLYDERPHKIKFQNRPDSSSPDIRRSVSLNCFTSSTLLAWLVYLWNLFLCTLRTNLELKVLSQTPHTTDIPSKWFASMWWLITLTRPSFPHTLQIKAFACFGLPFAVPAGIILLLFSRCILAMFSKRLIKFQKISKKIYYEKKLTLTNKSSAS